MKTTSKIIDGVLHEYDSKGNEIYTEEPNGRRTFREFDSKGNEIYLKSQIGYSYPYERYSEYDSNGNCIHKKDSNRNEEWSEYDSKGTLIHYKNNRHVENWYDSNGNEITKKEFDKLNSTGSGKPAINESYSAAQISHELWLTARGSHYYGNTIRYKDFHSDLYVPTDSTENTDNLDNFDRGVEVNKLDHTIDADHTKQATRPLNKQSQSPLAIG